MLGFMFTAPLGRRLKRGRRLAASTAPTAHSSIAAAMGLALPSASTPMESPAIAPAAYCIVPINAEALPACA